jgi:hypothetical protein
MQQITQIQELINFMPQLAFSLKKQAPLIEARIPANGSHAPLHHTKLFLHKSASGPFFDTDNSLKLCL